MSRRHEDSGRRGGERHSRGTAPHEEHQGRPSAARGQDEPRGPPRHEHHEHHARPARDSHRSDWDGRRDYEHPSRDFARDRDYRSMRGDRGTLDYETDRDFGDAARELDKAREYGRDYDRERELDRRARLLDPERIARRPGFSPSGTFRSLDEGAQEDPRIGRADERPRRTSRSEEWGRLGARGAPPGAHRQGAVGQQGHSRHGLRGSDSWDEPEAWMDEMRELRPRDRPAEADVRLGGTQPSGHGPGIENMAPPQQGFSTSMSRADDHDMGHGGFLGGGYRPRTASASTGKGPRGYQRGDDRIRADICDHLMRAWMDSSDVDVQVEDGVVTLLGRVRGRDEKRAIEDVSEAVLGVKEVLNHLRLDRSEGARHPPASQAPLNPPEQGSDEDGALHS
ncbi:BON domain-containing protein [Myxococcus qinghaiensis]|uniref:BON domain-containing protein n=1 Tax=Myxococcus qinghaiensis TaxID=2906758 RepID=UPI0020A6F27A|nr:BON domain-containing protein [Myxococcus qinghaiensis]MCP3164326.1 BON domain-containing protein [Myxococcus qinghaiensis]